MGFAVTPGTGKTGILIAEDSVTQARQLQYLLEKHDFLVSVASDGEEALALVRRDKPAIVISDTLMPQMSGYDLCRQIKNDRTLRHIPVILLTTLADANDVIAGLQCGADNFVTKPYNEVYLLSRIQRLLTDEKPRANVHPWGGLKVSFGGRKYSIKADRRQVLSLLVSTYETAMQKNEELARVRDGLRELNDELEQRVAGRTAALRLEIDERKKVEKGLAESEQRYRSLVDLGAEVGEAIVMLQDENGKEGLQVFSNATWPCLTGYSSQELQNISFFDLVHPRDREASLLRHRRKMCGESMPGLFEIAIVRKDGTEVPVELTSARSTYQGSPTNVVYIRDITKRKRAAEELKRSEKKYRSLVENTTDLIFMVDENNRILSVNTAAARFLGKNVEEVVGKTLFDLFPEHLARRFSENMAKVFETGIPATEEGNLTAGERDIWINTSLSPITGLANEVVAVIGVSRDISKRKEMESQITHLASFPELNPNPIVELEEHGRISYANPVAIKQFPTLLELAGRHAYLSGIEDLVRQVSHEHSVEREVEVDNRCYMQTIQRLENSQTYRVYGMDITDRKKAEEKLRQSEEKLRLMFECMADGVSVLDLDRHVLEVNEAKARMHGYEKKDEMIGLDVQDLLSVQDRARVMDNIAKMLTIETSTSNEYTLVTKDKREFPAEVNSAVLRGASGQPVGYIALTRDITKRKQNENALRQVNQELEAFAYTAAHDMKAPLVTIQGFATMLRADLGENRPERVEEDVRLIETGISKMQGLLKTVLEYGRANRMLKPTGEVPLEEIIEESVQQMAGQVSLCGGTISVADEFPVTCVNRTAIVQVFNNLIQNSILYRDKNRPITVKIGHYESNDEVVYYVLDNGTGISPAQVNKVFEPFYRGASESPGTGLGLTIVKRIVEGHGGRVWIESEPGKGTAVCFTIATSNDKKG